VYDKTSDEIVFYQHHLSVRQL